MYFLLSLIIAIPAFFSLLNPWYFPMHDDSHVVRLFLLDTAISQGYLFPRWVDVFGFGFGYPLYNFYPPLVYYVSEGFRLLGTSYIWSIKAMIVLGYGLGAVGMYLLSLKVHKVHKVHKVAALVSATLFTFFTYHATLVYVRGALAEFWGMNILPFAFLSLELLREKPNARHGVFFAVTLALLILSHIFVALPFILFLSIYYLLSTIFVKKKFKYIFYSAIGGFLGACLSAFYWLPAMLERSYTLVRSLSISELFKIDLHFVYPSQFLYSPWGFGGSTTGPIDGMSFQLGRIHIALAALSFLLFIFLAFKKKLDTLYVMRYTLYAIMLLFSLFMTTEYSKFIWEGIPFLQYLQFPWRFLTFTGVFIAILGGFGVQYMSQLLEASKKKEVVVWVIGLSIMVGTAFQYHKYFKPEVNIYKTDKELTSFENIAWNMSERTFDFLPEGVPLKKSKHGTSVFDINEKKVSSIKYQVSKKDAAVIQSTDLFNEKTFNIESSKPFVFTLNTFNFLGWTARIDGGQLPISDDNKYKLITVQVPAGIHNLEFRFEDTPIRRLANAISLVGLAGTILLLGVSKFQKSKG